MPMLSLSRYLPAGLILTLGLGVTLTTTGWVGRWERLSRQSEFHKQTHNLTTALQRTTNRYNDLLLSISDLYYATANQVNDRVFSRFVQRTVGTYPGIQALEWAPLVSHEERGVYEQWLQDATRQAHISITERDRAGNLTTAAVRDSYVPVTFLEPWQTNEVALGYDLASDQTRRVALERARDTGEIAATGRLQLVQETVEDQYSFLVFAPVYRQPARTPEVRRKQLQGYILGVFRVVDVVEKSLTNLNYDIDFYIFDQTARPEDQLLGFYDAQTQKVTTQLDLPHSHRPGIKTLCSPETDCTQQIQLGQREWRIVFLRSGRLSPPWGTLAALLIGLLITATVLIYFSRWQSELERTRELSDLKLRLFSMASHELRTPLSVITISAQSLGANRGSLTLQQQASAIDRIQLAAKRMGRLVSDILTLTRAEAGKLEFTPEIVMLDSFCQQLFSQIQLKSGQTILLEGAAANTQAYIDKKLLQSILINLLSNASKYSQANSQIRVVITEEAKRLRFQVIDQGIGIPADAHGQIFEAFYRGQNVGEVQGTGLGLAVVKTCVDLHSGYLTVESGPEQGACISVILPWVE
ncbi:MAG: CHASE domain-containing protein [Pseudanabaenales cyanobacterium]|nr:CHASE domain-containing protein [Pseudanabaenales cyanobacterium]